MAHLYESFCAVALLLYTLAHNGHNADVKHQHITDDAAGPFLVQSVVCLSHFRHFIAKLYTVRKSCSICVRMICDTL